MVADTTLDERLAQKFAGRRDDELAQLHLALLYLGIFRHQIALKSCVELLKLVVISNHLQLVSRKNNHISIWDIEAMGTTVNATHVYTKTFTKMQLPQ